MQKYFGNADLLQFTIVLIVYAVCLHIRKPWRWILYGIWTAIIIGIPVFAKWSSGLSNANVIGGLLPYKDAFYYANGGQAIFSGNVIPAHGVQGAFRPLFPGMLAFLNGLTNNNLILSTIILTIFLGGSIAFAGREVNKFFGAWPAAVWMAMVFAFIRPMIAYTLTEIPSLALGCLGFVLLLRAAHSFNWLDFFLGGALYILGISIRAGTFFVLPLLVFWLGWMKHKEQKSPWIPMVVYALVFLFVFFAANSITPAFITDPSTETFGNFSWMLYGQAVGGAGWQYHMEALGTNDPQIVLTAALEKLQSYPLGMALGSLKAVRDFFSPGIRGIFYVLRFPNLAVRFSFYLICMVLLGLGIFYLIQQRKQPLHSFILFFSAGVLASIPFLPPIDGGNRFYAGSVPFIYLLCAMGLAIPFQIRQPSNVRVNNQTSITNIIFCCIAIALVVVILVFPPLQLRWTKNVDYPLPACGDDQTGYLTRFDRGSYIAISPDERSDCGKFPNLCLSAFKRYGQEKNNDDFYNQLISIVEESNHGIYVSSAYDLRSSRYYFLVVPKETPHFILSNAILNGCGREMKTKFQTIMIAEGSQ